MHNELPTQSYPDSWMGCRLGLLLVSVLLLGLLCGALFGKWTLSQDSCSDHCSLAAPPCRPSASYPSQLGLVDPSRYWLDWQPLSAASYFPFTGPPHSANGSSASSSRPSPDTYSTVLYHEYSGGAIAANRGDLLSAQLLNVQLIGNTFHLYVPHSSLDVVVPDKVQSDNNKQSVVARGVDMMSSIPFASHLLRSGVLDEWYAFAAAPAYTAANSQARGVEGALEETVPQGADRYSQATQCPVELDTFGRLRWLQSEQQERAGIGGSERGSGSGATVAVSDFHTRHGALLLHFFNLSALSFVESYCTGRAKGPRLWGVQLHVGALNVTDRSVCCSVETRRSLLYTGAEFKNHYHRTIDGIFNMFRYVNDLCFHPGASVSDLQLFVRAHRDLLPEFLQFFPVRSPSAVGAVRLLEELIAVSEACPVCFLAPVSVGTPKRYCSLDKSAARQHRGWADYYANTVDRTVNVSTELQRVALTQLAPQAKDHMSSVAATKPLRLSGTATGRGSTLHDSSHLFSAVHRYYEDGGNVTLSVFPVPADSRRPLRILMLARPNTRRWINSTWMADVVCRASTAFDVTVNNLEPQRQQQADTNQTSCDLVIFDPLPSKSNADFRRLIEQFRSVDVLVGVHGAGLTNVQYLRPGALLIDFIPMCSKYAMGEWVYDPTAPYPNEDRHYTSLSAEFRVHFVSIYAGTSECYDDSTSNDTTPSAVRINQSRNMTEEARAADLASHLQTILGAFIDMQTALHAHQFRRYNALTSSLRELSAGVNPRGRLYWPMIHVQAQPKGQGEVTTPLVRYGASAS